MCPLARNSPDSLIAIPHPLSPAAWPSRGSRPWLPDSLQQLPRRGEPQPAGEGHDRLKARRALAALEQADLRAVQVADLPERLLGEAGPFSVIAKVDGELTAHGFHGPPGSLHDTDDRSTDNT